MSRLKWGLQTSPHFVTYGELLHVWQRVDALGYDSAWLFDHFYPITGDPTGPCFEGWTMLTALALQTRRIHVGCLVLSISYRNPALLAKMGATLDVATGGRLEMALGAGWFEQEARSYGLEWPATRVRLRQLEEGLQIIKALWTNETSSFSAKHYRIDSARCNPPPVQHPHPPLWVGGQGEKVTLRIVADHADGWDMDMAPLDQYRHKLTVLAGHCEKRGRDPANVRKMIHFSGIISEDERSLAERVDVRAREWKTDRAGLEGRVLIGTPQQAAEKLLPYVELGVEHFVLSVAPPYDMTMLELFIGEVAPLVARMTGR